MHVSTIGYSEGTDAFDLYVARPDGDGQRPALLVVHMFGGRNAFVEARARAVAELGWVGAAIDLYGVGRRGTDRASSQALMMELIGDPERLRRRLRASFDAVRGLDGVDPERIGAIGFCFGGMCAILSARMGLPMRGVVSFHGLLKVGPGLDGPVPARILVLHGQDDPMVPPADVAAFAEEMKRVGAEWELHAYPRVMHAFTNPDADDPAFGTVYDADADRRSWAEMTRFFREVFA
ncbi:MAG: dienelactone hydrolase family protein [Myxococcales bacterium]|nr:dienelactone hydrolase family protein [Myxococcales bacterium]MCA9569173.1 dienelactone hydrolase family protein [Myxococcales bacterium]